MGGVSGRSRHEWPVSFCVFNLSISWTLKPRPTVCHYPHQQYYSLRRECGPWGGMDGRECNDGKCGLSFSILQLHIIWHHELTSSCSGSRGRRLVDRAGEGEMETRTVSVMGGV